jgi:hypothetical protein
MRTLLLILFLLTTTVGTSQMNSHQENHNRFFYNTTLNYGIHKNIPGWTDHGVGLEASAGNNWFLKYGKFCGLIRLTWMRLGFVFSDGLLIYASPLNLGIGNRFQLNEVMSFEAILHAGPLFVADDVIQEDGFISYLVMPEFKLNMIHFSIGIGYSFRREYHDISNVVNGHFHYFGLSFGKLFGNI